MSFRGLRSTTPQLTALISLLIIFITAPAPPAGTGLALAQGWSQPVRISEPGGCLYPQIMALGDTLHVVYENASLYDKISYVRSTDAGQTWSEHVVLSQRLGPTQFPRIVGSGSDLVVLWKQVFDTGVYRFNTGYARSTDSGVTWGETQYIFNPNRQHILYFAASASDSLLNIVINCRVVDSLVFYALRSTDFGVNWSDTTRIFGALESDIPDQATANAFVHFSWAGRFVSDSTWETYYLRSTNRGAGWSENLHISEHDQVHSYRPFICAQDTAVRLSWMDFKNSPHFYTGDIFVRGSYDRGTDWTPEIQITERHLSTASDIVSVGDTLYVVWRDERTDNGRASIYFSRSTDGGQTWSQEYRLDVDSSESRDPSITVANNRICVIWAESSGVYMTRYSQEPDAVDEEHGALPDKIGLTAHPNPFNSTVAITYSNAKGGDIKIMNSLGQLAKKFETKVSGNGEVLWDGTDSEGRPAASGIYFIRLFARGQSSSLKLIYVK